MKSCIVTCADEKFYGLLTDLLGSLNEKGLGSDKDVVVLDLGLNTEQKNELDGAYNFSVHCFPPDWKNVPLKWQGIVDEKKQPYLCKPFLRELVPGYDCYTWMDSDVWVQDIDFLTEFEDQARRGYLSICPQVDRCYATNYYPVNALQLGPLRFPYKIRGHFYNRLKDFFGTKVAWQYGFRHLFNSGVLSLHNNSPHWTGWQDALQRANLKKQKKRTQLCDQTLLTFACYENDLAVQIFPAKYNWLTRYAFPMYDEATDSLVAPYAPHERIRAVHLAAVRDRTVSYGISSIQDNNRKIETCLTWSDFQKAKQAKLDTE